MKKSTRKMLCWLAFSSSVFLSQRPKLRAQESNLKPSTNSLSAPSASSSVPRFVLFSGTVNDASGKPATGTVTLTFSLYEAQEGGAPLWSETQNVEVDAQGHYTAMLGAVHPDALPLDLFINVSARWLGVQPGLPGVGEQPRVLLMGVPYALKAADSDTLGGLPASAFVTLPIKNSAGLASGGPARTSSPFARPNNALPPVIGGGGTTNFIPIWVDSADLGNSVLFQSGIKIGLNNTAPTATFDVNGTIRGSQLLATSITKGGFAVLAKAVGTSGIAVLGGATGAGGKGVDGSVNATSSVGVQGSSVLGDGTSFGVAGAGAGRDTGVEGTSTNGPGVVGSAGFNGVIGHATSIVAFSGDIGVQGIADDNLGFGVKGIATDPSSVVVAGVSGEVQSPNGVGVFGNSGATDVFPSNTGGVGVMGEGSVGVEGLSVSIGVLGQAGFGSSNGTGVVGQGNSTGSIGVEGTANNGAGVIAANNNGTYSALFAFNAVGQTGTSLFAGDITGLLGCTVDGVGDLLCAGAKSAAVTLPDQRRVALYAVESPQNWFEDFGSGQLSNGETTITLDPTFAETINTAAGYHVFLTPNGDSEGLYVMRKTASSFEVHESRGGRSNIQFDYRIVALRKGYESVRMADVSEVFKKTAAQARELAARKRVPPPPTLAVRPTRLNRRAQVTGLLPKAN